MVLCRVLVNRRSGFRKTDLPFAFPHHLFRKFLSLSTTSVSSDSRTSLSARLKLVFDQIDSIDRDRSQKDEALQRIRTWRDSRSKDITSGDAIVAESEFSRAEYCDERKAVEEDGKSKKSREEEGFSQKVVELVHPWNEWIELMEKLCQQNYFDLKRKDEDSMVEKLGFNAQNFVEDGVDFTRDFQTVRMACVNFGRDRFDILRSLPKKDIQIMVGYGCPSLDKKVIFSGKLLRKYTHIDEGDVCSACSMRSSCERAYIVLNKEDEARTVDIMRILLTYAFDTISGTVSNKSLLEVKSVKTAVRKLLHNVVKLGSVPIDPTLPPPVIRKPLPKIKQPPPQPKRRVGRDDIEMKKGDWLCHKCDFMNFSKNAVCLQCNVKRPKRELLPGEWECPGCNFLNYRRNMACFNCDHKRPPDEYTQTRERYPRTHPVGPQRVLDREAISNAWNFDFDDDESDGAEVAKFETADSPRMTDETLSPAAGRAPPGSGFDDFDEEDDGPDSYELGVSKTRPFEDARRPKRKSGDGNPGRSWAGFRSDEDLGSGSRGGCGGFRRRGGRGRVGSGRMRSNDGDDGGGDDDESSDGYRSGVKSRRWGWGRMGSSGGGWRRGGADEGSRGRPSNRAGGGRGRGGRGGETRQHVEFNEAELPNRRRVVER